MDRLSMPEGSEVLPALAVGLLRYNGIRDGLGKISQENARFLSGIARIS